MVNEKIVQNSANAKPYYFALEATYNSCGCFILIRSKLRAFRVSQMALSSKILEMSKSQFLSNDEVNALKETSFHSKILKFKEQNSDFKNLPFHGQTSQKAKIIKDLICSDESNFR